jgi:hypothetical protein
MEYSLRLDGTYVDENPRYPSKGSTPKFLRYLMYKETPWSERRTNVIGGLELHAATHGIIALQEVLHGQLVDILTTLNHDAPDKWRYIGVGRDDGKKAGEYSPIFYNTEIHELISWRYFWLSETPDRPGRGWDATSTRICTVGRFGFRSPGNPTTHDFTILVTSHS